MSNIPPPPPMDPPPGFTPYRGSEFAPPRAHGRATAAMVCGIVGLLVCPIVLSVLAIVFGVTSKNDIDRSPGQYTNRGMAVAGLVLGIIGLCLMPVWWSVVYNRT